jgi:hypothetical protein
MPISPTDAEPPADNLIVVMESSTTCLTKNVTMPTTKTEMAVQLFVARNVEMGSLIVENSVIMVSRTLIPALMLAELPVFFPDVVTTSWIMVRSAIAVLPILTLLQTPADITAPSQFVETK